MLSDKYDVYIVIPLALVAMLVLLGFSKSFQVRQNKREAEVKYNCHLIQVALERYALYNDGLYPAYIFGGEKDSWDPTSDRACQVMLQPEDKLPPTDPLIDGGYLSTYPRNPFIDPGEGRTSVSFWTSGKYELGYGDPRFGYDGELMGNCLNDPLNLWSGPGQITYFANTLLDSEENCRNLTGMVVKNGTSNPFLNNPFYNHGGIPNWSREQPGKRTNKGLILAFWSGQFFYRAGGPPSIPVDLDKKNFTYIWDYKPLYYDRYLLGGYGAPRTKGIDCIRLTNEDGYTANNIKGYIDDPYNVHPYYGIKVRMSTPEVFGGGWKGWTPTFPYYDENRDWVYGAPDGYPDGIIILLISGGVYDDFTEKVSV